MVARYSDGKMCFFWGNLRTVLGKYTNPYGYFVRRRDMIPITPVVFF